ncbi:MAG: porin family protein [Candidatus Afipia apatlaquensis]|uniref:Porin family protein n=1 Tax=Candidatus Afipia apatlaquensis TaxID=2712852 RepID=A0A7C9RIU9_9BRAD|nr:porin family protein [Candidatus Afipia apatlaquensis]
MKMIAKYLASAALLTSPVLANAADLAVKAAPVTPVTAVYNWTGFYIGVNGGYGWGRQDPLNLISTRFDRTEFDLKGGLFGATAGAQIQQGAVVLGLESDIDWANIRGSGIVVPAIAGVPAPITLNLTTKTDGIITARARFGMAVNNILLYGTAGAAFLHETANGTSIAGVPCGTAGVLVGCTESHWRPGFAAGLGAEYAFTPNWTVKGEYLYISAAGTGANKDQLNLLRFGANYKF